MAYATPPGKCQVKGANLSAALVKLQTEKVVADYCYYRQRFVGLFWRLTPAAGAEYMAYQVRILTGRLVH